MNKLKNLISNLSKKHIIIITLSLVMVVAVVLGIYLTTTKPLLVFKENIIFEYGSKASDIKLDDLVIKEKSKYEKIEVIKDNKIDTMKIGKASIKLLVTYKDKTLEYILNYEVKDTKKPIITAKDLETAKGIKLDLAKYITAKDEIDGALKVEFIDNTDYNKPGTYEVIAKAIDKNNLLSEAKFKVVVKDMPKQTAKTNTANTANDDYYEDNDYDSSYDNSNSNVSHNSGSDNNSGGSVNDVVDTSLEDEGYIMYKDYGNFEACHVVMREVNIEHAGLWQSSLCNDLGQMYYLPMN